MVHWCTGAQRPDIVPSFVDSQFHFELAPYR